MGCISDLITASPSSQILMRWGQMEEEGITSIYIITNIMNGRLGTNANNIPSNKHVPSRLHYKNAGIFPTTGHGEMLFHHFKGNIP